jgi:hypothetical protein
MIESQRGRADQTEFVEFVRAGESAAGQFECVACQSAVVHRGELPACPGCGGTLWERSSWTPFARVLSALGDRLN